MTFFLKRQLKKISTRQAPRAEFLSSLTKTLEARGYIQTTRPVSMKRFMISPRVALASLVAIVVSFGTAGTAAFAYASDSVLPDHALYPLREAVESVQYAVTPVEQKPLIEIRHSRRRLKEMALSEARYSVRDEARKEMIEERIAKVAERIEQRAEDNALTNKKNKVRLGRSDWVKVEAADLKELIRERKEARENGSRQRPTKEIEDQLDLLEEGFRE